MKKKGWKIKVFLVFFCSLGAIYFWLRSGAGSLKPHPFYKNTEFETIAHRGGAGLRPENTLEALEYAAAIGVDILEFDIRMTLDGHLILLHDKDLARTTNCKGTVAEKTLTDLMRCDAGFRFSPSQSAVSEEIDDSVNSGSSYPFRGKGVRIPTLETVFTKFQEARMIIEIKPSNLSINKDFCDLIQKHRMESKVLVGSFHQEILDDFRARCPAVATSASPGEVIRFYLVTTLRLPELYTPVATALQIPPKLRRSSGSFLPEIEVITPRLVQYAHSKNIVIHAWTINEPQKMLTLKKMGVDGIMTDLPTILLDTVSPR